MFLDVVYSTAKAAAAAGDKRDGICFEAALAEALYSFKKWTRVYVELLGIVTVSAVGLTLRWGRTTASTAARWRPPHGTRARQSCILLCSEVRFPLGACLAAADRLM